MSASSTNKCEICKEEISKYKCPACYAKYCSVSCFKNHKSTEGQCSPQDTKEKVIQPPIPRNSNENKDDVESTIKIATEDTVPPEMLSRLCQNPKLLDMLHNPHLQQMLLQVDSPLSTEQSIAKAMMEPIFTEFSDACLQVVEPEKYEAET